MQIFILALLLTLHFSLSGFAASGTDLAQADSWSAQTQKLVSEGQYLSAAKAYEKKLEDPNLVKGEAKKIRDQYENLNIKMLFSRSESPASEFYTVKEGDNLYKIAKQYNTTTALVKRSNGLSKNTIFPGMKLKVIKGEFKIRVDKSENLMTLFLNGKPLKNFKVATGMENGTPAGQFKIIAKLENPTWYKTAGIVIPPGNPENSLGTRWLGFDYPGYGIHGTTEPESIGKQSTSGCVRMLNRDVEKLYDIVPYGTVVTITD